MAAHSRATGAFLLAVLTCAVTGCGDTSKALDFHNKMSAFDTRLESIANGFTAKIEQFGAGSLDSPGLRGAFDSALSQIEALIKEVKATPVPQLALGQETHDALMAYFESARQLWSTDMKELIDVLLDEALTEDQRQSKIAAIDTRVQTSTSAAISKVQTAQSQFAKKHGFRLQ